MACSRPLRRPKYSCMDSICPRTFEPGDTLTVQWYWRILATDEREFAFSNQLLDEDDRRHGQLRRREPFAPGYWPPGTSGITTFEIDIDPRGTDRRILAARRHV